MEIVITDTLPAGVEELARASSRATFYHGRTWLESVAAAHPRMALRCAVARRGREPIGYLPFFLLRYGPFLRAWSLPFGTYGGPVAVDGEAETALLDRYARLARDVRTLEAGWVDFAGSGAAWSGGATAQTHLVDLSGGFDALWKERFARKRRQYARGAERAGVTVARSVDRSDVRAYYRVYAARLALLGARSPHPERLFEELIARGGEGVRLYLARRAGEVLGGHFNFYHRDSVIAWYNVTTPAGDDVRAGSLLYATCMREACADGFRTYNLGGSLDKASLIRYKESLGGVPYRYTTHRRFGALGRLAWGVARVRRGR
ncbi:MAG: GNAT family N-acetyltransferase [Candidatus Krumholzibacteria bacterium]|nr:GNAT family N-acetyltransferase [Candidatus Krumholzibacteria bacterium]